MDEEINVTEFRKQYVAASSAQYTLDQADAVESHLINVWMRHKEDSHFVFSERCSVFNTLLHFSTQVLIEKDSMPICKYEHLLRWHDLSSLLSEDILTTSFLAARDESNRTTRKDFNWPNVIGHDNRALNCIFEKSMTDVHFHLNGSSLNFELNWLSLMNKAEGWHRQFKELKNYQHGSMLLRDDDALEPFYLRIMKAAALRVLLFDFVIADYKVNYIPRHDKQAAEMVLNCNSIEEALLHIKDVDNITQSLRRMYGKEYRGKNGKLSIPDYTTMPNNTLPYNKGDNRYIFSVLCGERWLLYSLFRYIYRTNHNIEDDVITWFYAYLLYRSQFRTELVQYNDTTGFANFALYEERKSTFIKSGSVYDILLSQMAASSFLHTGINRTLEARITPKDSSVKLWKHILETNRTIADDRFIEEDSMTNRLSYVLHFIKKKDNGKDRLSEYGLFRHYELRNTIKLQASAIWKLRSNVYNSITNQIVGIDAANSEIYARPEVFAQAFRFLRDNEYLGRSIGHCKDLGITFHVGEDFMDIIDGLRAIDEAINYMNMRNGDRIGHGLALGIKVDEYYQERHNFVIMPCQILLDNIVWLYNVGKSLSSFGAASRDLEILFETYFRKVYDDPTSHCTMWDYYQSWLLRGDNPELYYRKSNKIPNSFSRWNKYDQNDSAPVTGARNNDLAKQLYIRYHYDERVRTNGKKTEQAHLSDSIVRLISDVQEYMLDKIESLHIGIECNPTSNLRISHIKGYSVHPIVRMYNYQLDVNAPAHCISVSINTDDKGIFATSLEREYSLLALSLEKEYAKDHKNPPRLIYDWLDKIRELGFEQKF